MTTGVIHPGWLCARCLNPLHYVMLPDNAHGLACTTHGIAFYAASHGALDLGIIRTENPDDNNNFDAFLDAWDTTHDDARTATDLFPQPPTSANP